MYLLTRVSMRTSGVPICFSANLRISLMARGARFLKPLQTKRAINERSAKETHILWMYLWMWIVYSRVTSLFSAFFDLRSVFFVGGAISLVGKVLNTRMNCRNRSGRVGLKHEELADKITEHKRRLGQAREFRKPKRIPFRFKLHGNSPVIGGFCTEMSVHTQFLARIPKDLAVAFESKQKNQRNPREIRQNRRETGEKAAVGRPQPLGGLP